MAFVEAAWNSVDQLHDSLFIQGTSLTTVMKGGYFLGDGEILAESGETNGSLIQPTGNATLDIADQLVGLITESVINAYFKSSAAFVLHVSRNILGIGNRPCLLEPKIPFGQVLDAYGYAKNNYVEFDQTSCRDTFLNVAEWTNKMIGSCDQGGLSVLVKWDSFPSPI